MLGRRRGRTDLAPCRGAPVPLNDLQSLQPATTHFGAGMAGPRANLAVTKDGGTYNKLQRPDDLFDESTAMRKTNERKRDRAAVDRSIVGPASGNKRAKAQHSGPAPAAPQSSSDSRQYRSAAPVGECGMRMTLPIDEEEAQYSDDSMGEALAYLRSVR